MKRTVLLVYDEDLYQSVMTEDESATFLGFTTQELIRWGIVLLLVVVGFGSLINGGALSGSYFVSSVMFYIPIIAVMYFGILLGMYAAGMDPTKFEMVFIPSILIIMIVLGMFFANAIPTVEDDQREPGDSDNEVTTSEDEVISRNDDIENNNTNQGGQILNNTHGPSEFDLLLRNVVTAITIIVVLGILGAALYYMVNRKDFDPDIQIHKVQEYTKSPFESNNTIIEYYIQASMKIERLKGKAPDWYSPTFYAENVDRSPGPPLSSYFDKLTKIYELARFGKRKMSTEDVLEAKELFNQIRMQVDSLMNKIEKMEDNA